jgi:hypothetical protein
MLSLQRLLAASGLLAAVLMSNPLPGRAAPTDNPFQIELFGSMSPGTVGLDLPFTVPSGKTLVIEYVSGNCFVPSGQFCVFEVLTDVFVPARHGAKISATFNLDTDNVGTEVKIGKDTWRAGQQVLLYASGGTVVTVHVGRNDDTGSAESIDMSLSGHLE